MFKRFSIFVFAPLAIALIYFYLMYENTLPSDKDKFFSSYLDSKVVLSRLSHGELHIEAKNKEDAFLQLALRMHRIGFGN